MTEQKGRGQQWGRERVVGAIHVKLYPFVPFEFVTIHVFHIEIKIKLKKMTSA